MHQIEIKTTGELIDALITTEMKSSVRPSYENIHRRELLRFITTDRLAGRSSLIADLVNQLRSASKRCWDAQEDVMNSLDTEEIANAAIDAQRSNAERCRLIREIDKALNEQEYTALEKTYA